MTAYKIASVAVCYNFTRRGLSWNWISNLVVRLAAWMLGNWKPKNSLIAVFTVLHHIAGVKLHHSIIHYTPKYRRGYPAGHPKLLQLEVPLFMFIFPFSAHYSKQIQFNNSDIFINVTNTDILRTKVYIFKHVQCKSRSKDKTHPFLSKRILEVVNPWVPRITKCY